MAATDKAFEAEKTAFKTLQKRLQGVATAFQEPAGADAGFPDFGFTFEMPSGRKIDIHIEYKLNHTAQMGSMRDWMFDGRAFSTPDKNSEQKAELISLMNETPVAVNNGKRLLADLKKHFHHTVTNISSGSLTVIKDKFQRRAYLDNFKNKTRDFVIANISGTNLGRGIMVHYKNKFKKSMRPQASASILAMMIGDEIWFMDTSGNIPVDEQLLISNLIGAPNQIKPLTALDAKLEVRIQPRGLSAPASNPKLVSIDVMASYRLSRKPSGGTKII